MDAEKTDMGGRRMGKVSKTRIPCVLCDRWYSLDQVGTEIFISTGVCRSCYREGLEAETALWCIGKGYSKQALECQKICVDRHICYLLSRGVRL